MNFLEFNQKFPTEESIIKYFINIRYEEVTCPHCGCHKVYRRHDQPKLFTCKHCNNSFSVFKGTIFEKSSTDLRKWLYSLNMFLNAKKGISACQLQREIVSRLGETQQNFQTSCRQAKSEPNVLTT